MLGFVTCMLGNVSTLGLGLRRSARAATVVAGTLFGCGSADGARGQPSSGGAAGGGNTAGMPGGGAAGTGGGGNTSGSGYPSRGRAQHRFGKAAQRKADG